MSCFNIIPTFYCCLLCFIVLIVLHHLLFFISYCLLLSLIVSIVLIVFLLFLLLLLFLLSLLFLLFLYSSHSSYYSIVDLGLIITWSTVQQPYNNSSYTLLPQSLECCTPLLLTQTSGMSCIIYLSPIYFCSPKLLYP